MSMVAVIQTRITATILSFLVFRGVNLIKIYKYFIKGVELTTTWLTIISTASLVTVMILNVVFRYFLQIPLVWADEVSLYLFAWCTFLGAGLGVKHNEMAAVTLIIDYLPKSFLKYVQICIQLLIITFSVIAGKFAINWLLSPSTINTISPSAGLPMWVPYLVLPLGLVVITIFAIDNIINIFTRLLHFAEKNP